MKKYGQSSAFYGWLVCALAASFFCYEYLLRIEPSVMVNPLMKFFGVTAGGLSFLTAMYYYAYTPLQAVVGIFTDAFGARRVLITAIILCILGSIGFQETSNIYIAAFSRFLIGAGSAFAFVGVLKLAAIWLPRKRFAMFVGLTTALGMIGAMMGDIFMAWIVRNYGWQQVILISAFIGVVLVFAFALFVHDQKDLKDDEIGLNIGIGHYIKQFFLILKNQQIIYAGIIGCLLYTSLTVFGEMWGIPFVHAITHRMNLLSAEINSAVFLGWLAGSPLSGWLSDHFQTRKIPLFIGAIIAAMSISLVLLFPSMNVVMIAILLFIFGLSSSVEIICFAIGRDQVALEFTASAMAAINLIIMLGGMLLQPLIGFLLDYYWNGVIENGVRIYDASTFRITMVVIPVLMIIAALLSFSLEDRGMHGK